MAAKQGKVRPLTQSTAGHGKLPQLPPQNPGGKTVDLTLKNQKTIHEHPRSN